MIVLLVKCVYSYGLEILMLWHERTTPKSSGTQLLQRGPKATGKSPEQRWASVSKSLFWPLHLFKLMDQLRAGGLADSWASVGRPGKVSTCRCPYLLFEIWTVLESECCLQICHPHWLHPDERGLCGRLDVHQCQPSNFKGIGPLSCCRNISKKIDKSDFFP